MNLLIYSVCSKIFMSAGLLLITSSVWSQPKGKREFYEIKIYHVKDHAQEEKIDNYLQNALVPFLHKQSIAKVGVFKPIANDTAADKLIYVVIPAPSVDKLIQLSAFLEKDKSYQEASRDYNESTYSAPPYTRIESVILEAFPLAPVMQLPQLKTPLQEHVYELRSYESATEKLNRNKVQMFNEGGEVVLFKRLNFNAVFYANVISGSHMPNLMYMTSFDNMESREAHWKTFTDDAEWKKLSALPEYQHNVSHIDITLMKAAGYSDF